MKYKKLILKFYSYDKFCVKVKFTKIGNKIKMEIPFKMFCSQSKEELPRNYVYDKNDMCWGTLLSKSDLRKLENKPLFKKVALNNFFHHTCDGARKNNK